jgi:hypothetical protein
MFSVLNGIPLAYRESRQLVEVREVVNWWKSGKGEENLKPNSKS